MLAGAPHRPHGATPGEESMTPRYEVRREEDGSWTVYDAATDLPAVVNDVPQLGHGEDDARAVARELDELMGEDDED